MKRGFIIFLVLVTVGAVFSGITIVLLNDFPRIVQDWQETLTVRTPEQNITTEAAAQPNPAALTALPKSSASQTLTKEEEDQVRAMLKSLGITGSDFTETMKAYQHKNSLEVTGVLTTETLESIIRQLTVSKVASI